MPSPVDETRLVMIGLPESGKTTFLAALFHLVRVDNGIETSLVLAEMPGERAYFLDIERTWLQLDSMEHSVHPDPTDTRLKLRNRAGRLFEVHIPDVSGEVFDRLWEQGVWHDKVQRLTQDAFGVLIFVRADDVRRPDVLEVLKGEEAVDLSVADAEAASAADDGWRPEDVPTQTKLADLVEQVERVAGPIPIAIVVSAWDVAERSGETPEQWLRLQLPLLWQMLESAKDVRQFRIFGVSAQGGDVREPAVKEELAARTPPATRILVRDGVATSSDLTAPLTWLLTRNSSHVSPP
jgi:hypothetical protein